MKARGRNWLVFAVSSVVACVPELAGCGGTKITKTNGSGSTRPDGGSPGSDAIFPDTPMGTGGSGGAVDYDGPTNLGGFGGAPRGGATGTASGGAPGLDANTNIRDCLGCP